MKKKISILLCTTMLCLTGCTTISLTPRENDMIAEYAAYVLVKHNNNYFPKLKDQVTQETTKTWVTPETSASVNNGGTNGITSETPAMPEKTMKEALGMEGFDISYIGYDIMKEYKDDYFYWPAVEGTTLIVCKFQITNQLAQENICNILEKKLSFRCVINQEKKVNAQHTMLLNDLSYLEDSFAANESKEAILIFQVPDTYEGNITSLQLIIKSEEESHTYPLIK